MIAQKSNLIKEDWNGFNVLNKYASGLGGLTVEFVPYKAGCRLKKLKIL